MPQGCRICRHGGPHGERIAREMMYGTREAFRYLECPGCGCVQIEAVPGDMAPYYPGSYYAPMVGSRFRRLKDAVRRPVRARRFRELLRGGGPVQALFPETVIPGHLVAVMRRFGVDTGAAVLDVGCGTGKFLRHLHAAGFRRLTGIDPYLPADATLAGGIRLLRRQVHELEGTFDLVLATHSLEHVPDQHAAMEAVSRLLAPRGVAVVRIPTVSSEAWDIYGTDWVQLDAPRHFYLHSRGSFRLLAEAHGLDVADVRDDSTEIQFWGSEQYRKDVPLNAPESFSVNHRTRLFSKEDMETYRRRADALNREGRGDQFSAALVKR